MLVRNVRREYYIVKKEPRLFLLNYQVICQLNKTSCGRDGYPIVLYIGFMIKHFSVFTDEHGINTKCLFFALSANSSPRYWYHSITLAFLLSFTVLGFTIPFTVDRGAVVKFTFLEPKTRI